MITEKNYPIELVWLVEYTFIYLIFIPIVLVSILSSLLKGEPDFGYILYLPILLIVVILPALKRATFHYAVDEKYLVLQQGIINKAQRNIPYGVIQNVYVSQDLSDRVFELATLTLENASVGGGEQQTKVFGIPYNNKTKRIKMPGFSGNEVLIPGLKKENAEALKQLILQKMKENPLVERGL